MKLGTPIAGATTLLLLLAGLTFQVPRAAAADASAACSRMTDPIYQRVRPANAASLLTPWIKEAKGSVAFGFSQDDGTLFKASIAPAPDLVMVHRLKRSRDIDFSVSWKADEIADAKAGGYVDEGKSFYAFAAPGPCLVPVYRYLKDKKHRFAVTSEARAGLADEGWKSEGAAFYAVPKAATADPEPPAPGTDAEFTFAVYPDTQQEVFKDGRFIDRSNWLVANKSELDLRFVTHTGDVVNWDTPDHAQYEVASKAMKPLEEAHIPYSMAVGNHDTQATGPGGVARDPKRTRILQRDTHVFNDYFDTERFGGVSGSFEADKIDNLYSVYEAGGAKWLVLTLELWPRQAAVDWAKRVVAGHPDANVIVVTHDYLDPKGDLEQSAGYGDTSPQSLYDQLVSRYPNVRMVLSGHVGATSHRVDTGEAGNKIYSFMTTIHSNHTNPIRLFTIDTETGSLRTRVYAPWNDQTWSKATESIDGIDWVR